MGILAVDTDVEPIGDGRYRAALSEDWAIWGPNGGYLAAVALRAAGRHTALYRPASLYCRYLGVPEFGAAELHVTGVRALRSESLRVTMTQKDKVVLEADVCSVARMRGPDRSWVAHPDIPPPEALRPLEQDALEVGRPPVPFWRNVETRALRDGQPAPGDPPGEPVLFAWHRFRPQATFDDLWADACRAVILIDTGQFPAVTRGFMVSELTFIAPSLDVYVAFHTAAPDQEWLLTETSGMGAAAGVIGGHARLWSRDGRLVATGGQQMLVIPARTPW